MKVVLQKDIRGTGKAHTVVEVKDGHAINFLFPRKLAVPATDAAVQHAETRAQKADEARALSAKLVEERLSALADGRVVIKKKVNEQNHLYDKVDAKELAEAAGLPVEAIAIDAPFKEAGQFDVPVAYGDNFGKFILSIEAE